MQQLSGKNSTLFLTEFSILMILFRNTVGLEYQTGLNCEWLKVVQTLNGSDLEWDFNTKKPDHSKSDQIASILDSFVLVLFCMVGTVCVVAMAYLLPFNSPDDPALLRVCYSCMLCTTCVWI